MEIGRDIVQTRNETYLNLILGWIKNCNKYHPNCQNPPRPLPSRVIDVGEDSRSDIRLHVSSNEHSAYAALSHCWGKALTTKTTKLNYSSRRQGIPFSEFPQTFQDAITLTRDLGLRFLWIDSLCIIQDDNNDWEVESGNMAAIYQNAYIVIGADRSDNCHGGILVPENRHQRKSLPIATHDNPDGSQATVNARMHDTHSNICDIYGRANTPLDTRGSTLQEQLLASRMVNFTDSELIWECNTQTRCECMELDQSDATYHNGKLSYNESLKSADKAKKFKAWWELISAYSRRDLTYRTDLLPALSRVVKQMQGHGYTNHLAGLWEENMPDALMWSVASHERTKRVVPFRAPSWSWASLTRSEDSFNNFSPETNAIHPTMTDVCAKILEASCTPAGKDPTGAVTSGYLRISAPFIEVGWMSDDSHSRPVTLLALDDKISESASVSLDYEIKLGNELLYCLLVGEIANVQNTTKTQLQGLILRKLKADGAYERIGTFTVYNAQKRDIGSFSMPKRHL